jgi:hypothetical protein
MWDCVDKVALGQVFSVLRFPLPIFIPPIAPKIILIYHRGLYNWPKWPQYQGQGDKQFYMTKK